MRYAPAPVVLLLLGLAASSGSLADELPTALGPSPAIRDEDLAERLGVVASEAFAGRETGTAGARQAAEYIAAELARVGVEPAGAAGSYFQPYALGRPRLGAANALELRAPGREALEARVGVDYEPFSMSRSGEAKGGVVFAGYGITAPQRRWATATGETLAGWDDYAGVDVRGKVVLALRKDPGWGDARHAAFRAKVENAARHGAAALLLCNDRATALGTSDGLVGHRDPSGLPTGAAPIPCAFVSRAFAARLLGTDVEGLTAVETSLLAMGPASRALSGREVALRTQIERSTELDARNVVGYLPGTDPDRRDEVVLVGAHFDHLGHGRFGSLGGAPARGRIHPGADDNASGTVALLELAEYFAAREHRPRRSLLFVAFSGEEMGLLGSTHYVREPVRPLESTVAMVNLDMIGRLRERRLHVIGVGTGGGLEALVREANQGVGLDLQLNPGGAAGSDSLPFFRKQVPVLFFFTGMHDDYHRPSDTAASIELEGLEQVSRLVAEVVARLANADERLVYTEPPAPRQPPVLGIALGEATERGVEVAAVAQGGAAAAAGLQAGDVILVLADQQVHDPRALRAAILGLEAGRAVAIVVVRDGRRLTLEIVPRARGGGGGR